MKVGIVSAPYVLRYCLAIHNLPADITLEIIGEDLGHKHSSASEILYRRSWDKKIEEGSEE